MNNELVYAANAQYTIRNNGNGWYLVTKSDGTARLFAWLDNAFRWAEGT